ncbi:MAG: TerB family tellurite resistance protein [Gammaproteobacteria bacterium]|nr:MAG: TerB family tellurite resistance protein [Gammaproteobacteria bacterium]
MISTIQGLLKKCTYDLEDNRAGREEALRTAVAVLLMEVARSEDGVSDEERQAIHRIIEAQHSVSPEKARAIAAAAEREAEQATSLHPFTRLVVDECSLEERTEVIRMLWEIGFSDGNAGAHEQHLVRKVAGLLHVPHSDFIRMKLQQKTS